MANQSQSYANLEIRLLGRHVEGYPVELTLNGKQEYTGGHLASNFLPWVPGASQAEDGERLFNWLLADHRLQTAWAEIRGQQPQRRIRLRIDATAPELHTIPWELLRDVSPGFMPQTLAADADTPFSRYLAGQWPPGQLVAERPLKMLVAIANADNLTDYEGLTPIDVQLERTIVEAATADLDSQNLTLAFLPPPVTLSQLEAKLKQGYHLLHLIAHGRVSNRSPEAMLYLADENNKVALVREIEFAEMLQRQQQVPQFVFLASCQGASHNPADAFRGLAPQLIIAGVPVVLAMQDLVSMKTARVFTRTFYRQLFNHGQVDLAANEARSALITGKLPGIGLPVLYSRLPNNVLFDFGPGKSTLASKSDESFARVQAEQSILSSGEKSLRDDPGSNHARAQYYSCLIGYADDDQDFAERLYFDLQKAGVPCWYAPEDMKIGDRRRPSLDQSVWAQNKLLLILSEHSIASDWVEQVVETAIEKEQEQGDLVLFPIRLDEAVMNEKLGWAAHIRRTRYIGDFSQWREPEAYQRALNRLLRNLQNSR